MKTELTFKIILLILFTTLKVKPQCTNCTSQYPSGTQSTSSNSWVTISTCMFGGDYAVCSVVAGQTYEWQTCGDTDFDTQITIYQDPNCSGPALAYNDDYCGQQSLVSWTATFTGNVRVLISRYNCNNQSTCMTLQWRCVTCSVPPLTNDDPCNAITLPVNSSCIYQTFSNAGATASSGVPAPGCGNYQGGDVWFKFTVPPSGAFVINSNTGVVTDGAMAIYSGGCSALSLIECDDDDSENGLMPKIDRSCNPLTPGTTIYIRFWEYGNDNNGSFQICVQEVAASGAQSNQCLGGITICSNSTFNGNSNGQGCSNELNTSNQGCLSSEHQSSWYFFSSTTNGTIEFTVSPVDPLDDYDFAIWGPFSPGSNANSICPNLNMPPIRCSYSALDGNTGLYFGAGDNSEGAGGDKWVEGLNVLAGQVYVLLLDNFSASGNPFNFNWELNGANLNCTPLPIELLNFKAYPISPYKNIVEWTVQTEYNTKGYYVIKTYNYSDIDTLLFFPSKSNGFSYDILNYKVEDSFMKLNTDVIYYQLIEISNNNDQKAFPWIQVAPLREYIDNAFPNPTNSSISINLEKAFNISDKIIIEIYDVMSNKVLEQIVNNNDVSIVQININNLEKGLYLLKVLSDNGTLIKQQKIIKE